MIRGDPQEFPGNPVRGGDPVRGDMEVGRGTQGTQGAQGLGIVRRPGARKT